MDTATHMLRTGRRGALFEVNMGFRDLGTSFQRIGLAWSLAWHDIVSRYRGSILGPFWITLSMGLMVAGMGVLYARLFGISLHDFIPFVATGIVFFGVISGIINEGCDAFVHAAGMLSQTALPMFTFVWRVVFRNLINLAHNFVIILGVLVYFGYWRTMNLPVAVVGLLFLVINSAWVGMLAAIASARFRDVPQIVISVMQFAFFMTPVMWQPARLGRAHAFLLFNPFYHMLDAVRAPLIGDHPDPHTYSFLALMAVVGWALTFTVFTRTRRRIVHYL
ncbi:MAG TPA: ABC transporter permease [Phenylobacterium sp.]|nr:ABC transporter permease [Phenylobacterium sp.]